MQDVIVVGSGPAGASASIYLKRAGIDVLNISNSKTSLENAKIENYYGFLGKDGKTLYENGITQLKELNVEIINAEVLSIESDGSVAKCITDQGTFEAKYIVLALGLKRLNDPRFKDRIGLGVSLCAHCDGPMFRNRTINVTGRGKDLEYMIQELKTYSSDIRIIDIDKIKGLNGNGFLESIEYTDGKIEEIDNIFLALPIDSSRLSMELGLFLDSNGFVKADSSMTTNIKNVYAIGDMLPGIHQVVVAAYQGFVAALDIINKIKNN